MDNKAWESTKKRVATLAAYVMAFLERFLWTIFVPWYTNYDAIKAIQDSPAGPEQDQLTTKWVNSKTAELQYVGLTSGVIAAAVTGAFSWFNSNRSVPFTRCCWSACLLLALTSVTIATQQFLALTRISSHANGISRIRLIIGRKHQPKFLQLYVWQVPVMLLNISVIMFVMGLSVHLLQTVSEESRKDVLVFYGLLGGFAGLNYVASWTILYAATVEAVKVA